LNQIWTVAFSTAGASDASTLKSGLEVMSERKEVLVIKHG
jgi:hypothetical protein